MKRILLILIALAIATPLVSYPDTASAAEAKDWKAGRIVDDVVFQNPNEMTVAAIQAFLESKLPYCDKNGTKQSELGGGTRAQYGAANGNPAPFTCITGYYEVPKLTPGGGVPVNNYGQYNANGTPYIPSGAKSASQIIFDVAHKYQINPKALIIKLATESPGPLTSDEWPFRSQYLYAMGARCPDSGPGGAANCDSNYAGFSLQMDEAGKLLRSYLDNMQESWWPYKKPFANNSILWNVTERGCGAGNVYIESKATAALYTYTPYQPNQAALNNMYGTGDSCSAYGNRNFWRAWVDWFGTTLDQVRYVQDASSAAQYIVYDGKKQALTHDGLLAWGIDSLPLSSMSTASLNALPTVNTPLTRYAVIEGTSAQIFLDDGTYYDVTDPIKKSWGDFRGITRSTVGWKVLSLPKFGGLLQNLVTKDSSQYLMEGGTLYPFSNPSVVRTWSRAGAPSTVLSDRYYTDTPVSSSVVTTNIASSPSGAYLLDGQVAHPVSQDFAPLLQDLNKFTVSDASISRYSKQQPLSHLIRQRGETISYLIDNSRKSRFEYSPILDALRNNERWETLLSSDAMSLLPTSSQWINTAFLKDATTGSVSLVNRDKRSVSTNLATELGVSNRSFTVSTDLLKLFKDAGAASHYLQQNNTSSQYFVTGGQRYAISNATILNLIGGSKSVTSINSSDLSVIPQAGRAMTPYISAPGGDSVLLDSTQSFDVTNQAAAIQAWGLSNPIPVSQATYDQLANINKVPLSNNIQARNGEFCLIDSQARYCAEQFPMIHAWNLTKGLIRPSDSLLSHYNLSRKGPLPRFVGTSTGTNSPHIFTAIDGKLYRVGSPSTLFNLGYGGGPILSIAEDNLNSKVSVTGFNGYTIRNIADGSNWVIDGGGKRLVPTNITPYWGGNYLAVSPSYLDFYSRRADATRSVTSTSTPAVFGVDYGRKRAISTYDKYLNGWTTYTSVTPYLLDTMPNGPDI